MSDDNLLIQNALEANPLREPVFRAVIQALKLPAGSRGLDAGCGIGLQALLLADEVGPHGWVTGLDMSHGVLAYGQQRAAEAGLAERVTFCQGDAGQLPYANERFDWAWSADCIGYPLGDLTPALVELRRVVRPGGCVILLGWSAQQLLPGYPALEAQLNATCSAYLPYYQGKPPEQHFARAQGAFRAAGLVDVRADTFTGTLQAPLSAGERTALLGLFGMLWGQPLPDTPPEVWDGYRRICTPDSPDFILNHPDYYAFFSYSLFRGQVPPR